MFKKEEDIFCTFNNSSISKPARYKEPNPTFDNTENLPPTFLGISKELISFTFAKVFNLLSSSVIIKRFDLSIL